ncbi:hypothetical protein CPter91_1034 [Collimonas pratensis]|uniref:Uncharacterized protein n=1 Tax=Collimonas pratensis TaxID=279113 RepID=A0A127Q037_9BURK|nr:hypothetical protein CPter91_1034 [Collimonas pratensis]
MKADTQAGIGNRQAAHKDIKKLAENYTVVAADRQKTAVCAPPSFTWRCQNTSG